MKTLLSFVVVVLLVAGNVQAQYVQPNFYASDSGQGYSSLYTPGQMVPGTYDPAYRQGAYVRPQDDGWRPATDPYRRPEVVVNNYVRVEGQTECRRNTDGGVWNGYNWQYNVQPSYCQPTCQTYQPCQSNITYNNGWQTVGPQPGNGCYYQTPQYQSYGNGCYTTPRYFFNRQYCSPYYSQPAYSNCW